jgi:hypothetical protein
MRIAERLPVGRPYGTYTVSQCFSTYMTSLRLQPFYFRFPCFILFLHAMSARAVTLGQGFLFAAEEYAVAPFHGLAGAALQGAVNFQPFVAGMGDLSCRYEMVQLAMAGESGGEGGVEDHYPPPSAS